MEPNASQESIFWFVVLGLFVSGQTEWLNIPNHDEEIYFNHNERVTSFQEAKDWCQELHAIPLVLWKIPVLKFVGDFFVKG